MTDRDRIMAVLNYKPYDRLPVVHFGYWQETLDKWAAEGHIDTEHARTWADGNPADQAVGARLGFDCNYYSTFAPHADLFPPFEEKVLEVLPDGSRKVLNPAGMIVLQKPGAGSIPPEVDHLLKGRKEWEDLYLPKLQFSEDRVDSAVVYVDGKPVSFAEGGRDYLARNDRTHVLGLQCGSLFGVIRNWLGLEGVSYLYADDEALYDEIIDTVGDLCYQCVEAVLASGAQFDYAHFWEDICFKSGPLVVPRVFDAKVGPHYKRITDLVARHGITIVSLDCDGLIDALIPTWLANGVNTMFPIEVGTWNASIEPWREKYGRELRGVGGVRKQVFAEGFAFVDAEIERLKPLVALSGYIPCPDHRIPPNAEWDTVRYYCDHMHRTFG